MRQFKITILWQQTGHVDEIFHTFHPSHTKQITVDDFISMISLCVSKRISSCHTEAQTYITRYLLDDSQVNEISDGFLQSLEEVDA